MALGGGPFGGDWVTRVDPLRVGLEPREPPTFRQGKTEESSVTADHVSTGLRRPAPGLRERTAVASGQPAAPWEQPAPSTWPGARGPSYRGVLLPTTGLPRESCLSSDAPLLGGLTQPRGRTTQHSGARSLSFWERPPRPRAAHAHTTRDCPGHAGPLLAHGLTQHPWNPGLGSGCSNPRHVCFVRGPLREPSCVDYDLRGSRRSGKRFLPGRSQGPRAHLGHGPAGGEQRFAWPARASKL